MTAKKRESLTHRATWSGLSCPCFAPPENLTAFRSSISAKACCKHHALELLQAVISEAEATQPPGEPYAQAIIDLAEWMPRVSRACENPETPQDQLQSYLVEVNDSLEQLQELVLTTAAA